MPGAVGSRKQYTSVGAFTRDERKMLREGWKTEAISLTDRRRTLSQLLFWRPAGVTVDAHYLRSHWPTVPA